MTVLGIDIGGSGIKGAPVDVDAGALIEERVRVETPRPATPDAVLPALVEVAGSWKGSDPVGVTFPGVVRRGVIGSAANLHPDWLVPDAELGHLELHGADAELHASDRIRDEKGLSWPDWATRVQDYIAHVERLISPDLIVLGGGVSKKADRFLPYVKVGTPVVPAVLQNNAGIVGAAMATTGQR